MFAFAAFAAYGNFFQATRSRVWLYAAAAFAARVFFLCSFGQIPSCGFIVYVDAINN